MIDISYMTARDIFDTVSVHLLKQGKASMFQGSCKYRNGEGLSCAIGCLIPEDCYKTSMEGWGVSELIDGKEDGMVVNNDDPLVISVLNALQALHDRTPAHEWEHALGALGLRWKFIDNPIVVKYVVALQRS